MADFILFVRAHPSGGAFFIFVNFYFAWAPLVRTTYHKHNVTTKNVKFIEVGLPTRRKIHPNRAAYNMVLDDYFDNYCLAGLSHGWRLEKPVIHFQ